MAATEPLLSGWQDEKASPSLEDGKANLEPEMRAKATNPFRLTLLLLTVIAVGLVHIIQYEIGSMMSERKPIIFDGDRVHHSQIVDFKDITPSEKLEWHQCFGNYRCARLTVPIDYNRPLNESQDNPKVHIALLLVPGRNHTDSGKYSKSPLLINPGGPGGSGVGFAMFGGPSLQQVVGHEQDIIGFDPRGIGYTTPVADCFAFPSDRKRKELTAEEISLGIFHKFLWGLSALEIGLVNSSVDSLEKLDNRDRASAKLCETKDALYGQDSILRHVSTPAVARDMLSIVDAWDAWMEEERKDDEISRTKIEFRSPDAAAEDKSLDTKGKLVYWGFSYGTLLGATFAAMFPDRVGRVILDGVVDADYYVSPMWEESLLDTDKIMVSFFHFCHKAGKNCALYRDGDSESDIHARFETASENLKKNPIRGVNPATLSPAVITHQFLKLVVFQALYSPIATFPFMALIADMLYRRDETTLLSIFQTDHGARPDFFCSKKIFAGYEGHDAQLAIMCSDKRYPLNESLPNLRARYEKMATISTFADVWMTLMIGCDAWSITATDPPMRWDDHPSHSPKPINTSFPLLFLSNTQDPVTPLAAGVKMARKFVDAGLVEQHGAGHCSIAAASRCTLQKVREYLGPEGKVPRRPRWGPGGEGDVGDGGDWERCARDNWPWKGYGAFGSWGEEEEEEVNGGGEEGDDMMRAWARFRDISATHLRFWGLRDGSVDIDWWKLAHLRDKGRDQRTGSHVSC